MKTILPFWIALLCLGGTTASAQKQFHNGKDYVKFTEDTTTVLVHLKPYIFKDNFINAHKDNYDLKHSNGDILALKVPATTTSKAYTQQLAEDPNIDFSYHALYNNNVPIILTGDIMLELKYGETIEETLKAAGLTGKITERENPTTTLEKAKGQVLPDSVRPMQIFITSKEEAFEVSNRIYETGKVRYAHPDFYVTVQTTLLNTSDPMYMSKLIETVPVLKTHLLFFNPPPTPPNDPLYFVQFNMAPLGNIDSAWLWYDWAKATYPSNQGIVILDDGLDLGANKHPDLNAVAGYNSANPSGGGIPLFTSDYHGTVCASLAASIRNNGICIAGIASGATVKSVNIINLSLAQIVSNLHWAWFSSGYRVLSNSWTFTTLTSVPAVTSEITNGMYYGSAAGDGCIWVFSSGDNTGTAVGYPNNVPGVYTVGAIASGTGPRDSYSNYGPEIEISATVVPAGLPGADRIGSLGQNSTDQISSFAGTSAACPQVAGVAQILANVMPTATGNQIQSALNQGAVDVTSTGIGFDYETGYGQVNVYRSVACLINIVAKIKALPITSPLFCDFEMDVPDPWSPAVGPYAYNWSVDTNYAKISMLAGFPNKRRIRVTKVGPINSFLTLTCSFGPVANIPIVKTYNINITAGGISRVAKDTTTGLKTMYVPTQIMTTTNKLHIVAGPVPAHNTLTVSLEDDKHQKVSIDRIDLFNLTQTRSVFTQKCPTHTQIQTLSVSGYSQGVYLLTLYSGNERVTKTINIF